MVIICIISIMAGNTSCMLQYCVSWTYYHPFLFWRGSKMGASRRVGVGLILVINVSENVAPTTTASMTPTTTSTTPTVAARTLIILLLLLIVVIIMVILLLLLLLILLLLIIITMLALLLIILMHYKHDSNDKSATITI